MEAMILAAGAGVRLRPLTDRVPKALVEVDGRPLLGWVLDRLRAAGATRVVVNTHHHEEQIRAYLQDNPPKGVEIILSPEPDGPYDTGGGLFAAAPLFREDGPILLHNVDVLSEIPLDELLDRHTAARIRVREELEGPAEVDEWGEEGRGHLLASLAVQERDSNRRLLFDEVGLMGWENRGEEGTPIWTHQVREPVGEMRRRSFTGIHVVEPEIFDLSPRTGAFSIITLYLELAAQGHVIHPLDVTGHRWIDVGTPERLEEAKGAFPAGQ